MIRNKIIAISLSLLISNIFAQNIVRVMTYNILNYPTKIASTRNPYFKIVIETADPDILVVQEMENYSGVSQYLNNVLDTLYSAGDFVDGYDTDNALFYKHSQFEFIDNTPIRTDLRNISQFRLLHKISSDTLIVYSAHLKASDGFENEQKRLNEVIKLREVTDELQSKSHFILVGDFNIYSSSEPAFQKLIDDSLPGYFVDPLNRTGDWNNNVIFRGLHTQSTRTESLADEGSTGGLDDRFDMILVSQSVKDTGGLTYINGSYETLGNDGNHFNKALNILPNAFVSDDVALALYFASDHLPVFADFEIQTATSIDHESNKNIPNNITLYQNYPNPFNPITTIKYFIPDQLSSSAYKKGTVKEDVFVSLKIYDILGREIATLVNDNRKSGTYEVDWFADFKNSNAVSGTYIYVLNVNGQILSKKMILLK